MLRPYAAAAVVAVTGLALLLGGCSGDDALAPPTDPDRVVVAPAEDGAGHTHAGGEGAAVLGDGVSSTVAGYTLDQVVLPTTPGEPGEVSFRVLDADGLPLLDYTEEQTQLLHLYVVRQDLSQFRHLHPTLADDGTWSAQVNLADPGPYRVIVEFAPAADEEGRHVVLSREGVMPGTWDPVPVVEATTATDGVVEVAAPATMAVGEDERMTLTLSDGDAGVLNLGSYLGAASHLTGFNVDSGQFVHVHPYGEPVVDDTGTTLTFHTSFTQPGEYRFFVQVRVDGFVHTVPVTSTVV